MANIHDSRAAIEEARAANAVATSVQRITSLTSVYLPITLAAVSIQFTLFFKNFKFSFNAGITQTIYGMNLSPITGDEAQKGIWAFIAVSAGLLLVTFGVLSIWIWKNWAIEWYKRVSTRRNTAMRRGSKLEEQEKSVEP